MNKLLKELKDKISDLEAKLAESEFKVAVGRFWHSAYEGKQLDYDELNNDYNKQEKLLSEVLANKSKLQFEFDQLKQLLAEKDKELEGMSVSSDWQSLLILKQETEILEQENKVLKERTQDEILFAVEQLEKVKKWVVRQLFITTKDCSNLDKAEAKGCNELREETIKEIDNQINRLKGDNKNV